MEISYFNNKTVTLRLLPVCECGHVFKDGVCVTEKVEAIKDYKYAIYSIEPATCPNCNRRIEAVSWDTSLLKERF